MIPELGQFALVLALCLSVVQAISGLAGRTGALGQDWQALVRPTAVGQFVFVAAAIGILAHGFLVSDFSIRYVAANSNVNLPVFYKFAAVWGGHEGSMLLWIFVLALWTLAVAFGSRSLPDDFASRVIGVLGVVSTGMMLFTLLTSNPFDRLIPAAVAGNDLNPLLQDPAMVLHPPMLYIGYVGMAVPFSFAVAALLSGRLNRDWARWTRPWTVMAWVFLTIGIALGSWWAYYELGWGGWWFWDPVENASFMPWLAGTALIHSLAVTERRGIFKSWTLLLAITAFSLSLLGTFLVRSGVLISVHAFASDPTRGLFILALLGVITGGALLLYAVRARRMAAEGGFGLVSRESFLLLNNVLLLAATGAVLFGTLYPLFLDALGLGKISVGPPYFNLVFMIPMLPLAALVGLGMHSAWRSTEADALLRRLRIPALVAIVAGIALPWLLYGRAGVLTMIGVALGLWVVGASLLEPLARLRAGRSLRLSRGQWGMIVAHAGLGAFILGATVTSSYNVETDRSARPGDQWEVAGYDFVFRSMREIQGPNFDAVEAEFEIRRDGRLLTILTPQKRVYHVQKSPMTEAGIDGGLGRDLFVALGEPVGGGAWSVRVQYKPLVRWLWLGAVIMALGGILAASDPRYRRARVAAEAEFAAREATSPAARSS